LKSFGTGRCLLGHKEEAEAERWHAVTAVPTFGKGQVSHKLCNNTSLTIFIHYQWRCFIHFS